MWTYTHSPFAPSCILTTTLLTPPQIEEDGWLNPKIVDHFVKYAKLCFTRFGDRVKYWITINEPWCAAVLGHDSGGQHAPGRTVDPAREVYKVAHHMLIAHARTYQMYQ
jgi:beta-glucosidase/6-phospho-beta-glucosidase/beta-galactosidase